jgi:hypothetical protein
MITSTAPENVAGAHAPFKDKSLTMLDGLLQKEIDVLDRISYSQKADHKYPRRDD